MVAEDLQQELSRLNEELERRVAELSAANEELRREVSERRRVEGTLRDSERLLQRLLQNIPGGSVNVFDRNFRYLFAAGRGLVQAGQKAEELIGRTLSELFPQKVVDYVVSYYRRAFAGETVAFEMEAGGRWYRLTAAPFEDSGDRVVSIITVAQDISGRRQVEERLRQSESQLEEAQQLARLGNWNWDLRNNILFWSNEQYHIFGVSPQTFSPTFESIIEELIIPDDRERVRSIIGNTFSTHEPFNFNYRIRRHDGELRVIHARGSLVCDAGGEAVRMFGTAQDVTEEIRVKEMLKDFSQRLIEAQEAERHHVARELHDGIGQTLTAIKLNLQSLRVPPRVAPQLHETTDLVDRVLGQIREMSLNLRPTQLDDLGLVAALRWHLDRESRRAGLASEFSADLPETRLPTELETACFRIAQEALTNVIRHARAACVWVGLSLLGAELHLRICDDGVGFDVGAVQTPRVSELNMGLQGMYERALLVGGKLKINSSPGYGTEIIACFPIAPHSSFRGED